MRTCEGGTFWGSAKQTRAPLTSSGRFRSILHGRRKTEGVLGMMLQSDAVVKTEAAARRAIELDPRTGKRIRRWGLPRASLNGTGRTRKKT
jgi:hypothetical protein